MSISSSLVADRQVVLQMVVKFLCCAQNLFFALHSLSGYLQSLVFVGDFSTISKMSISSLFAVRHVVLQMVVQVCLLCLNTILCIAHPVM